MHPFSQLTQVCTQRHTVLDYLGYKTYQTYFKGNINTKICPKMPKICKLSEIYKLLKIYKFVN